MAFLLVALFLLFMRGLDEERGGKCVFATLELKVDIVCV
jgi:hypothetical protein